MRAARSATGCVLVAVSVLGCSSGDPGGGTHDAPSVRSFCAAVGQFRDDVQAADPDDVPAYVAALRTAASTLDGVGTPDGMPTSARAGFELTIQRIEELPEAATEADLERLGDVDQDDETTLEALEEYVKQTCPELTKTASPSPG